MILPRLARRVVGVWRPQKKGNRLLLAVMPFSHLDAAAGEEIEEKAVTMAPFREANTVEATFGNVLQGGLPVTYSGSGAAAVESVNGRKLARGTGWLLDLVQVIRIASRLGYFI